MKLTVETPMEIGIALFAAVLVVAGVAMMYPPAALVVAGLFLLASLVDLRRSRP